MDLAALEQRWQSISYSTAAPYRSLRIAADCIPELYLSLDMKGGRFLILQVPKQVKVTCPSFKMQNLSIEWHEETRFILIGLLNNRFSDLYNDLTLSMYNRIKNVSNAETYTTEFISTFHKWAEFFEEAQSNQLSETELKGLFGELVFLEWLLNNSTDLSTDEILHAWQGPFGRANDFIFSNHNVELKAKTVSEINVTISSEYQMQTETGKGLKLAIVDLQPHNDGVTLGKLIDNIRTAIFNKRAELSIFVKAIAKSGISLNNAGSYDNYKWCPVSIMLYKADNADFPKITSASLQSGISKIKYSLNTTVLEKHVIQRIVL